MTLTHWPSLTIRSLDTNAPPEATSSWLLDDAHISINCKPGRVSTSRKFGNIPSWDSFPSMFRPETILDERAPERITPTSVIALIRSLAPRGTYQVRSTAKELKKTLFGENSLPTSRAFAEYTKAVSLIFTSNSGLLSVYKDCDSEALLTSVPLRELAPGTLTAIQPEAYSRRAPRLEVPESLSEALRRATSDYADVLPPPGEVVILKNAKVTGYGQVVVGEAIVEESFVHNFHLINRGQHFGIGNKRYLSTAQLDDIPNTRTVEGPCVVLKQTWDSNYGHWLIDTFSRIAALDGLVDLSTLTFLLNSPSGPIRDVMLMSLELLGVPHSNIIFAGTQTWLIRQAIYVTPMTRAPLIKHPATIRFLEGLVDVAETLGGINRAPHGKIYLSRGNFGKRRLINEDELTPLLRRSGYTILAPETLGLLDQIATFAHATHIIGVMGAAFTNLAFCMTEVRAMLLGTQAMQHDYFYDIVCHKAGKYVGVQGRALDAGAGLASDFDIDVDNVIRVAAEEGFLPSATENNSPLAIRTDTTAELYASIKEKASDRYILSSQVRESVGFDIGVRPGDSTKLVIILDGDGKRPIQESDWIQNLRASDVSIVALRPVGKVPADPDHYDRSLTRALLELLPALEKSFASTITVIIGFGRAGRFGEEMIALGADRKLLTFARPDYADILSKVDEDTLKSNKPTWVVNTGDPDFSHHLRSIDHLQHSSNLIVFRCFMGDGVPQPPIDVVAAALDAAFSGNIKTPAFPQLVPVPLSDLDELSPAEEPQILAPKNRGLIPAGPVEISGTATPGGIIVIEIGSGSPRAIRISESGQFSFSAPIAVGKDWRIRAYTVTDGKQSRIAEITVDTCHESPS